MADFEVAFHVGEVDGEVVVTAAGEIDMATAAEFEAVLHAAAAATEANLVLDLSDVSYIDSSGLRVLIAINQARGEHRRLRLRGASDQVRKLLAITRIDHTVTFDDAIS